MFSLLLAIAIAPSEEFLLNENPELETKEILFIENTEKALIKYVEKEIKEIISINKSFKEIE